MSLLVEVEGLVNKWDRRATLAADDGEFARATAIRCCIAEMIVEASPSFEFKFTPIGGAPVDVAFAVPEPPKTGGDRMGEALGLAASKLANREAGAVDEAIAALMVAGVPLNEVEVLISAGGGATVVRQRQGPPVEVGQHSGYYP